MRDAQCNNDKLHTALYGECLRAMMFPGPPTRARNPYTRQRHPKGWRCFLYIENPRIVRGFSKSFSVASSKSYSFRVRLDCGPSTAIKTLKEAI